MSSDPPGPSHLAYKVGAVVVSGLVLNWLSDSFTPTAPLLLVLSFAALILLLVTESTKYGKSFGAVTKSNLATARFGLTALLLGAVIGGLWLLPLGPTVFYSAPTLVDEFLASFRTSAAPFHNYEMWAAFTVVALGCIALARKAPLFQVVSFVAAGCCGSALTLASLRPENDFFATFASWAIASVLIVLIASVLPGSVIAMREFFGLGRTRKEVEDSDPEEERPELLDSEGSDSVDFVDQTRDPSVAES